LKNIDRSHIDKLNTEAWEVRVSNSVLSGKHSTEAVEQARKIDYTRGLADGLRTQGFFYIRQSNHDDAVRCLLEAEKLMEGLSDQRGLSDIKEYRGIIARNLGDLKASLEFLFESLKLRRDTGYVEGESLSLYHLGVTYRYLGNLPKALDYFLESITVGKKSETWIAEAYSINNIGAIYFEMGDIANALDYFTRSLDMRRTAGDLWGAAGCYDNIGKIWLQQQDPEKARGYFDEAMQISRSVGDKKGEANASLHLGEGAMARGDLQQASSFWGNSLELRKQIGDKKGQAEVLLFMADLPGYKDRQSLLEQALQLGNETGTLDIISVAHQKLSNHFKNQRRFEEAFVHLEAFQEADKAFHSRGLAQRIAHLKMEHDVEQTRKEAEIFRLRTVELAQLVDEKEKQKHRAEEALKSLQAAQAQLIQSEKMASLGELTAGIAHEIQNPLNFVNNFSEINTELSEEILEAADKGNLEEIKALAISIKSNQEKIRDHGKRADAIVKGMLLHSRSSIGTKEPTDIAALADEYLRLAYHGMRARDNTFQASIKTSYEPGLPLVPVVAQDIARVLLNLFNNAFYAVHERSKAEGDGYEPEVLVQIGWAVGTPNTAIQISVQDNGPGIPESIKAKIFQPFFTTKPTGQGTGLGLSLSYDIVKANGGEVLVSSREGEGTEFTISIPM
jgi:signal transduction histidine kinase